jgi:phosphonopyruvate decarboxylase
MVPADLPAYQDAVSRADDVLATGRIAALLIQKGAITGPARPRAGDEAYSMSRLDAIRVVAESIADTDAIVSTTGKISRELFTVKDRPGNFYMQGSMGHAMAIALGIATTAPARTVVVLDGDGAAIMHMGTLSTIGHYAPPRLIHIVLDNEAYGSTGNQATTSSTTAFEKVALACGYRIGLRCTTAAELRDALDIARRGPGPSCILAKVNLEEAAAGPRVTSKYTPQQTRHRFSMFLRES